ncbi:MAG TPA: hypothetical protein D7H99_05020 [Candidatus Poseidoniales archaeon]|nr:MAG TPA: hypothetical protein D7H99_05020 [Candidatus Poseidoniales archaeon]HII58305.1 transglutaminase domain-containing protein [Candidatus Poseidoniaceae archaeon]|tara:strand:+ start:61 stop:8994 length:8934 start_codon:yes stop_codon:yes gene_type:complete
MRKRSIVTPPVAKLQIVKHNDAMKSISLILLMLLSSMASIQFFAIDASATNTDQDGDGLTYGLEYLINSFPNDPDTDNDGLPDGWEWKYGLNPLSSANDDGAVGDPDGDGMSNLQEYTYLMPSGWDNPSTPNTLDNGIWWNGTVPVNDWNEEDSLQYLRPLCGDAGSDGSGNTILCDEDPVGNVCANGFDDDQDGLVDSADPDGDGDADCFSDDDDGDGLIDEDVSGWDTDGDGMPDGWEAANGLNATSPSNADGPNGDPDGDGLNNLLEYVNPTWDTMCGSVPCFRNGPDGGFTETTSPCDPVMGIGPGGCATYTAEVDGITSTNPQRADSDNDGLNDSYEALILLTDPTASDTDNDGIPDGVEVNGLYGNPPQASDPRNNNTDGDAFDDGEEDNNSNGVVDQGETDPTRKEDSGDEDQDGLQNWEENLSCTLWDVADSDFGGVNDGEELNVTHGTDPCDSFVNFATTITSWNSGSSLLTLQDSSGFNPNGGEGWYNSSGTLIPFSYISVSSQSLVGVSVGPSVGVSEVLNRNGSFCHTSATAAGTLSTTQQYCDDDYEDSDGDGLADWEEILGVYGWFSNPGLVDTDSDGVSDFDEVFDFTDPNEPCNNLLDDDSDSLNNYFEDTTGCDLIWIGIGNGSLDSWVTDPNLFDTDSGGVDDRTEYSDGTNPQSNPLDDILPEDFDGDGIPDAIENLTGTDWTNPDTDGGGMSDGDECPIEFWATNCLSSPFDPFDPTDDITPNGVVFWANNTTGNVDLNQIHRWRLTTNDFYTGTTYAQIEETHPYETLVPGFTNFTDLPDSSFSNGSIDWDITFNNTIDRGKIPVSSNYNNITFWSDPSSEVLRSDGTSDLKLGFGTIDSLFLKQEEYFVDFDSLAANTFIGPFNDYELITLSDYDEQTSDIYFVNQTVQQLVLNSSSSDAYTISKTISDYLKEGNSTDSFRLYNSPLDNIDTPDITSYVLENKIGQCQDYNAAFVTMARLAGIPARYVTGYVGGEWNGNGYTVSAQDRTSWGEVRLGLGTGANQIDMGWVPFDSCPQAETVDVVNQSLLPLEWDRDQINKFSISGQFVFSENLSAISDYVLDLFIVPVNEITTINNGGLTPERQIGSVVTDSNGNFSLTENPIEAPKPGLHSIVIKFSGFELVPENFVLMDNIVNITDDSVITHTSPLSVNNPVVGAGSTTLIQGLISYENAPEGYSIDTENQTVSLSFDTNFNGTNNISGIISPSGVWSVIVELDETEPLGPIDATLWYEGWAEELESTQVFSGKHLRASSLNLTFDVREAPNLTATVEGPLSSNNSLILVDDDIFVNGTAKSLGPNPVDMAGQLVLSIREAGEFGSWLPLFNRTVNGTFSIVEALNASDLPLAAGLVELQLRFFPSLIDATDDANLSVNEPYKLVSYLQFVFNTNPTLRGQNGAFNVDIMDHNMELVDLAEGNFDFFFNNTWFNTTSNLSGIHVLSIDLDSNLEAKDYDLRVQYNGSDNYAASSGNGILRVKGGIGWNFVIGQDWTHIGNSTYVNGTIFDEIYQTPILGDNISQYTISLSTGEGDLIDIAQGFVDNQTSSFNTTFVMPTNVGSNGYNFEVNFDFYSQAPTGGPFFASGDPIIDSSGALTDQPIPTFLAGAESEFVVTQGERIAESVLTNNDVEMNVTITDIGSRSILEGISVEYYFDWNNTNVSMGTIITDESGIANLTWNAAGIAPGEYSIMALVQDDLTDPLAVGNSRRTGNFTLFDIVVKSTTDIRIDSIPNSITAGLDFTVVGQVIDAEDVSRTLIDSVKLKVNWLDNENETLVTSYETAANGNFNLTVPTDTSNNGTVRGAKTLVITVIEESSIYYTGSSKQSSIFVFGVTQFDSIQPLNAVVINRGDSVNMTAQLVESSNLFQPLSGFDVTYQFGGTPIGTVLTDGRGFANITHNIPFSQPLGITTVDVIFVGSSDLLGVSANFSTINIRSLTFLVIDDIVDNPVAGEQFNISGTITSDNGSGLEQVDGSLLPANILFDINGESIGFTVSGGFVTVGGYWNASILLSPNFAAGNNTIEAAYIPAVNFYLGSNSTTQFDTRGFTEIRFIEPALDIQGQPTLNDRVERGNDLDVEVLLIDNTGLPVEGQLITITLVGTQITTILTTAENGTAFGTIPIPANMSVGEKSVNAIFTGTPGTTGLVGSESNSTFVVLASTDITITDFPTSLVAGDYMLVNGSLLDDLGQQLAIEGIPSSAVVHLMIDDVSVASIETNSSSGEFSLGYMLPDDISAGSHTITVEFFGGRDWVDPIGVGEPSNPEYYLPSTATVQFNVSVPTKISLITEGGDVNREEIMIIEGLLLDVVDNPLSELTVEVWLDGEFMTNVTTDSSGLFTAIYPVPADAELGPVLLEIRFIGSQFYLPSDANGTWNIFSHIILDVSLPETLAVGQNVTIIGNVADNQLSPISNHQVELIIEGITIASVITNENGEFTYNWLVTDLFDFGNHTLTAYSGSQGYYRANSTNTTFFLAHRADITASFDTNPQVTRGDIWEISGRLFDIDSLTNEGLENEVLAIYLDGELVATTTTGVNGDWNVVILASQDLTRGQHQFDVVFEGTYSHIGTNQELAAFVWANLQVSIDSSSTNVAVRSDGTFGPITITGSISEIGGTGEIFENLIINVGNGTECATQREGAKCIPSSLVNVNWFNGNFTIDTVAPSWYDVGSQYIYLDVLENSSLYLNGVSVNRAIFIKLNVDYQWDIAQIEESGNNEVTGGITILANDTGLGVPGISVIYTLLNESNGQLANPRTVVTDPSGLAEFEFISDPPFGDFERWGYVTIDVQINDPIISENSKQKFESLRTSNEFSPKYKFDEEESTVPTWAYVLILLVIALVAAGIVTYRMKNKNELLQEAAEVFAYTAELLAAGDSIRETIFTCYQNMCSVLQQNGFLRRDFETVREFEVAIRQAMPQISDDALTALDNMFEMARYSRDEMGAQHQQAAQMALERMVQEISSLAAIPNR